MLLSLIDDIPQKKRAKSFSMDRSNSEKKKKITSHFTSSDHLLALDREGWWSEKLGDSAPRVKQILARTSIVWKQVWLISRPRRFNPSREKSIIIGRE